MSHRHTSIRMTDAQYMKLGMMADELGSNRNQVLGQLIDNAVIGEVIRREPVSFAANENTGALGLDNLSAGVGVANHS